MLQVRASGGKSLSVAVEAIVHHSGSDFVGLFPRQTAQMTAVALRRCIFSWPKSIQASVTLLENLHIILEKTPKDEIQTEVMPIIYNALDTSTAQIQVRAKGNT